MNPEIVPLDRRSERIALAIEGRKQERRNRIDARSLAEQQLDAVEELGAPRLVELMMRPGWSPTGQTPASKGAAWLLPNGKVEYRP